MSRYYRRRQTGRRESVQAGLVAGALAAVAGAVSFYLVKVFLSREPLEPLPAEPSEETAGDRPTGVE